MKELIYDTEDCICALATPWASSALAVVRLTGKGCIPAFGPFFSRPEVLTASTGGTVHHGHVQTASGEPLDEVVVTVWKAPRSYTGQDSLEISCHGSLAVLRRVLDELTRKAFRPAGPGEFTLRAFLNGKLDLTRAEAVQELVSAKTDSARSLALHRLGGSVESRVLELRRRLLDLSAVFNVQLDYAEDEVDTQEVPKGQVEGLIRDLEALSSTYRTGRVFQEGLRVVLAGRTNAGKSSLFNLFLKEDRSIVSEEHGTTRDFIEAWVSLGEIPARLYDTAGLREADGLVEQEGIRRSRELLAGADLVFYLVDATDPVFEDLAVEDSKLLRLWTKIDSPSAQPVPQGWIGVSSLTGSGLE
ncbi:MAG: tRNA uridine-5-carboxymethylaminomethyl(34) synthesis GTPase MnmE, partial [Spirochaetales bacterium]|nr:tRNA uridine-5-carboxymethylaminomethyl(34) synthesis GTPase MnmE [Spirochaetales bacterium]